MLEKTNLGTCLKNLSMQQADHQRRRGGQRGLTLKGLLMGIQHFKYVCAFDGDGAISNYTKPSTFGN